MFLSSLRYSLNCKLCQKTLVNCSKYNFCQAKYSRKILLRGYMILAQSSNNSYNNYLNKSSTNLFYHTTINKYNEVNASNIAESELDVVKFEKISNETLDSLTEYFDELIENTSHLDDADVSYGDGVLTVKFGDKYGTYVINRQTPNRQIWLSSPTSGPKRYDFIDHTWIYKHDGKCMHDLLDNEIPAIIRGPSLFSKCIYGKRVK